jgi:UDP-sulfoquinovose synthase
MRVLVLGWDGYLGWPLVQYLAERGHTIVGLDNYFRREWVKEVDSHSAIEIATPERRRLAFQEHFDRRALWHDDLLSHDTIKGTLLDVQPEAVVHLAECPSAAYSMIDAKHAAYVQQNNVIGTLNLLFAMRDFCPEAHLVKLGTMGEYGTPNIDIPEGFFEIEYRGRKDTLSFPRQAGSFYHLSKVHDTHNIMFACKTWGLRSTDIMQGVVYGTRFNDVEDARLLTRLDFDECFGTAINRFCCQAVVGEPLTVYGAGGQTRGYLPLRDSMQCITLAIENPPEAAEYRVFNQFEEVYSVRELAMSVSEAANNFGLKPEIQYIENPRVEAEEHYYNPDHQHLLDLGYQPTHDMQAELHLVLSDLVQFRERIELRRSKLTPKIRWKP